MFTRDDLVFDKDDYNIIKLRTDPSCSMAEVEFNGHSVLFGNYWDFHPRCYGHDLGRDFRGPEALVALIEDICRERHTSAYVRKFEVPFDDVKCAFKPDPTAFTLNRCGLCPCGATSFSAHIEGEAGGLRITSSSLGVWNTSATIEPGDPRYRTCIGHLEDELNGPHKEEAQRLLHHLPEVPDLEARERAWLEQFDSRSLGDLYWGGWGRRDDWGALQRLQQAGITTCGQLARHTQATLKKLPGIGNATAMAAARAFSGRRHNWSALREGLSSPVAA